MSNKFKCPFSFQEIDQTEIRSSTSDKFYTSWYPIKTSNNEVYVKICVSFLSMFSNPSAEFLSEFEKIRPVLLYKILNNDYSDLGGSTFHWDCNDAKNKEKQVVLIDHFSILLNNPKYPKNRKQKSDNLLLYIRNNQKQEGAKVTIIDDVSIWGNLFF